MQDRTRFIRNGTEVTTIKETYYFASKVIVFCNLNRLHIFFNSVQVKYVDTASYDSQKILADISLSMSNLKITNNLCDKTMSLTPDDLFSLYTEFIPLLSSNILTLLLYSFMVCLSSCKKQCAPEALFYPIFRDRILLFCRNRRYKF